METDQAFGEDRFETVESQAFRGGMSRVGAAVSVVTTMFDGEPFGFTASAVCSVSDAPATLLACINKGSSSFPAFERTRHFCVNTLSWGQRSISDAFGSKIGMVERFAHGSWINGQIGSPVLVDALVSFECELSHFVDQGTHRVLFGRVVEIRYGEDEPALIYRSRRYMFSG